MHCPNCNEEMEARVYDYQYILHCLKCGSSFFEENGINRITLSSAKELAAEKKGKFTLGEVKNCPKDGSELEPVRNEESVPAEVNLLKCKQCNGIFAFPEDLLSFKKAQQAKIDYFKMWKIPFPSLKTLLLLSIFGVVSVSLFTTFWSFQNRYTKPTHAEDIVQNFNAYTSDRYLTISFETESPYRSRVVFVDKTKNTSIPKRINDTAKKLHFLTTADVDFNDIIEYTLVLTDENGRQIRTEQKKLEIK